MIWLKKIWNDPVGSKVIAGGIIWLIGTFSIWMYGAIVELSFRDAWRAFYALKIPVFWCLVVIFSLWLLFSVFRRMFGARHHLDVNHVYTELKRYNKKQIGEVLWKWDVLIDGVYYQKPGISNLTPYCLKHNLPLKMKLIVSSFECPAPDCHNIVATGSMYSMNYSNIQTIIESELEAKYEELVAK